MAMVVRPCDAAFNASSTIFSDAVSRAEVASSKRLRHVKYFDIPTRTCSQNFGLSKECPCNRYSLSLPSRQGIAFCPDKRVEAILQGNLFKLDDEVAVVLNLR